MLNHFFLAMKLLWREWRAGEWAIVFIALLLAITATTSIHFYTDRLTRGIDQQSARFLGGDLAISSPTPIPDAWEKKAEALHLRSAQVWTYPSVVSTHNQLQLVNLQAVSSTYPLLGTSKRPLAHTIWVEPRLLPLLAIKRNDNLDIGAAHFRVSELLTPDIDTLNTGFLIAPRVLMLLADVPATKTVLPGSRVDYRLLLVGDQENVVRFQQWLAPLLNPGQRLFDIHTQPLALKSILQRAQDYLQLVLLVCLLMSGVAIALSIQHYLRRHYAHVALWRCLGAKRGQVIQIFLWQLFIIALFAGCIAVTLGYLSQSFFANLFTQFLQFPLPPAGLAPVALGFSVSFLLLFIFAYPIIHELPRTSPLLIWRNEAALPSINRFVYLTTGLLLLSGCIYWFMNFSQLALNFLCCLFLSLVALYLFSLGLIVVCRIVLAYSDGALRRGLSQIIHHSQSISLQFIGFNLILISLVVLSMIRTHLIANWQQSLPNQTPNYFAFNIAPADIPSMQTLFQQHNIALKGIYPMVRGRLTTLNGQPILQAVPASAINNNTLHRELNLSWMWELPADNQIVSGKAFSLQDKGKPLVSVENTLATDLHLHLGDKLTFQIGDRTLSANIANFRSVEWSSFHPNFFMIFTPGLLQDLPTTFITSFHLSVPQNVLLNQLIKQFPNITIIDVASLLQQMQTLVSKMTTAIQYLFLFALGAGVLIFLTSLQASMDERRQTYSLLRVLGASKRYIRHSLLAEFGCLALLILLTTGLLSLCIVYVLEAAIFTL